MVRRPAGRPWGVRPATRIMRAVFATDGRLSISAAGNPSGDTRSTELDVTVVVRGSTEAATGRRG